MEKEGLTSIFVESWLFVAMVCYILCLTAVIYVHVVSCQYCFNGLASKRDSTIVLSYSSLIVL